MELVTGKHFTFRSTKGERPKPSVLITGPPGAGKTLLSVELGLKLLGCDVSDMLIVEFPEDAEGVETLRDRGFVWVEVKSMEAVDELYTTLLKAKPKGLVLDNIPAAWKMFFTARCPSGVMSEDHGKTWNALGYDLTARLITRFKCLPSLGYFAATSTVWPDKDEFTAQEGKLQVTLPGQLKGNIYGLFSYALNIKMSEAQGKAVRILETQPSAKVVAKVRAPLSEQPKANIVYDLASAVIGIDHIVRELKLGGSDGTV